MSTVDSIFSIVFFSFFVCRYLSQHYGVCIYIHIYMYIYMHANIHIYMHKNTYIENDTRESKCMYLIDKHHKICKHKKYIRS